jgi:hypothetical protein
MSAKGMNELAVFAISYFEDMLQYTSMMIEALSD